MHKDDVAAYLARVGLSRPAHPNDQFLRELHRAHLFSVPFENLSIHLAEPIELTEAALLDKLVRRRRGGFCYELNGALAMLLEALGFQVTMLEARSIGGPTLGPPFDHLVLRVEGSAPWLADVGFGRLCHYPLRLVPNTDQEDPEGILRLVERSDGDLDLLLDGAPQYRVAPRPRGLPDFEATCWWHQTSPRSSFTRGPVCTLPTRDGRITLSGRTLVQTRRGTRDEVELTSDGEVRGAYRRHFGIDLDRVP